ncbi:MAG: hypothetical protein RI897_3390 [Verrucomicrobiota bacterium]
MIDGGEPAELVGFLAEAGFAAAVDEAFVEGVGFFGVQVFEPGAAEGEDAGGFVAIIGEEFRGFPGEVGGEVAIVPAVGIGGGMGEVALDFVGGGMQCWGEVVMVAELTEGHVGEVAIIEAPIGFGFSADEFESMAAHGDGGEAEGSAAGEVGQGGVAAVFEG